VLNSLSCASLTRFASSTPIDARCVTARPRAGACTTASKEAEKKMGAFPHHVQGDAPATVYTVLGASLLMVLAGGLGGLPFFFVPKGLSKRAAGLANALSAGVMLSASYTMVYEAHNGPRGCVCGLLLGALFVRWSRGFVEEGHADGLLGEKTRGLHVFLATMALHSISEGAGVGVAYARSSGEASGVRRGALVATAIGAHNIPEGFGVALALVARGVGPGRATWWAVLTSAPQLLAAAPAFLFCNLYAPLHPLCLGFAAGCMISVVIGEMIPEALETASSDDVASCTTLACGLFEGFRMTLDWAAHEPDHAGRVLAALAWSVVAGGATAVGGLVVACAPRKARRFDGAALGFAAGVMLALAVLDIALPHYYDRGAKAGGPYRAVGAFLGGALCVHVLKSLLASCDDATLLLDEAPLRRSRSDEELKDATAARTAWLVTLALAAHNAPEGLAVGVAAAHEDTGRAALMAFAIGMHNVPEGVAVASSVYAATRSRERAFVVAAATGLVEPLAAGLSAAVLSPFLSPEVLELALLGVAGAMIAVSLLELVPSAWRAAPRPAIIGGLGGWWVLRIGLDFVAAAHA